MGQVSTAGRGLAPGLGPHLTSTDSRLYTQAQESALDRAGGAFSLHELGLSCRSVLIGLWGTQTQGGEHLGLGPHAGAGFVFPWKQRKKAEDTGKTS